MFQWMCYQEDLVPLFKKYLSLVESQKWKGLWWNRHPRPFPNRRLLCWVFFGWLFKAPAWLACSRQVLQSVGLQWENRQFSTDRVPFCPFYCSTYAQPIKSAYLLWELGMGWKVKTNMKVWYSSNFWMIKTQLKKFLHLSEMGLIPPSRTSWFLLQLHLGAVSFLYFALLPPHPIQV